MSPDLREEMETEDWWDEPDETRDTATRGESRRESLSVQAISTVAGMSTLSEIDVMQVIVILSPVDTLIRAGGSLRIITVGAGTV